MKNIILAIFFCVVFVDIGSSAKILLRDGEQFPPGEILEIKDRTVFVKTSFGNLQSSFDKISSILIDENADPTRPKIRFKNGNKITGYVESLKDGIITIKMKYGVYIVKDIFSIESINIIDTIDKLDYDDNALNGMFNLNQHESIYGKLQLMEQGIIVINTDYGQINVGLSSIE